MRERKQVIVRERERERERIEADTYRECASHSKHKQQEPAVQEKQKQTQNPLVHCHTTSGMLTEPERMAEDTGCLREACSTAPQ